MGEPILSLAAKLGEPSVIEASPLARYDRPMLREKTTSPYCTEMTAEGRISSTH